jgi:FkbM family methyltransferase
MKPFISEGQRYDYPLTPDSTVIDAGCYEGRWLKEISDRYGCKITAFEPCRAFYEKCLDRFVLYPKVTVIHAALGGSDRHETIGVQNDSTGIFCENKTERINVVSVVEFTKFKQYDLIKLNVEGMEFEILEALLDADAVTRFKNIQVQFHRCVPDCDRRLERIRERMSRTHSLTYCQDWVWENWERIG